MRARSILLAAPMLAVAACAKWEIRPGASPEAVFATRPPRQVQVTTVTGEQFQLANPSVQGDSLRGSVPGRGAATRAVATADVAMLDVQVIDRTTTAKWMVVVLLFGLIR